MQNIIRAAAAVAITAAAVLTLTTAPDAGADTQPVATTQAMQPVRVTVVDNSQGAWLGVQDAIDAWNASPLVDITMADTCQPGTYCVWMDAADHGTSGWIGLTTPLDAHHAHAQLNTSANPDRAQQTAVACHELGHVLGVDHPDGSQPADTRGCIAAPDPVNGTTVASDADRMELLRALNSSDTWGALTLDHRGTQS